jgi:hypothetical protein
LAIASPRLILTAAEDKMDVVFIERQFELGDSATVVLRFLRPEPDGDDYRCDYKIIWPDRELSAYAMGIDAVQALLLAMQKAHAYLLASPERKAGTLLYLGEHDLGLPLPPSSRAEDFD